MCKSSNKSGLFSRSVGTPDLRLFAEIFLFLNLLFVSSFFKIPERADVVRNFPDANLKIGKSWWKHLFFSDDLLSVTRAWIGQNVFMGKANKSIFSGLFPLIFGFLIVTETFESDTKFKSDHKQFADGSNEF